MSSQNASSLLQAAFIFASVSPLLTACDQWALLVNTDGVLHIAIVSYGDAPGRFRVRARASDGRSWIMDVPPSGKLDLSAMEARELELTLLAPPACRVEPPNPQTINGNMNETVNVAFDVHC